MNTAHGTVLVAAALSNHVIGHLAEDQGGGDIVEVDYTILVFQPKTREFITARVLNLDDKEWYWGHYFRSREQAVTDFLDRAGLAQGARV
jgi:hypothetical protein